MKAPLVVKTEHHIFGLTMTPDEVGSLLDLSDQAVRDQCRQGVLPTMPRVNLDGAAWRIPTCRLLAALGLPYEVVESSPAGRDEGASTPPDESLSTVPAGGEVAVAS